jgi:hypothetical protein
MQDLVCLQEFSSRMEAVMAREILAASGILTTLFADDGGGSFQGMLLSRGVARLMVLPGDRDHALQLLEELQRRAGEDDLAEDVE